MRQHVGVAARAATSSAELTGNIVQTLSAESSNEATDPSWRSRFEGRRRGRWTAGTSTAIGATKAMPSGGCDGPRRHQLIIHKNRSGLDGALDRCRSEAAAPAVVNRSESPALRHPLVGRSGRPRAPTGGGVTQCPLLAGRSAIGRHPEPQQRGGAELGSRQVDQESRSVGR